MELDFKSWPKIPRNSKNNIIITEKLNGTNSCVVIQDQKVVGVQSRKRFITPSDDNFGFASWVEENKTELESLGDGYHFGEWAGPGIQKNPHRLVEKRFYIFNVFMPSTTLPDNVYQVPILYQGEYSNEAIENSLELLGKGKIGVGKGRITIPEGIIVYYHLWKSRVKYTFENREGKWKND